MSEREFVTRTGLRLPHLAVGDVVTMSGNKRTGDLSWTREVWRVLALNGHRAVLELGEGQASWLGPHRRIVVTIAEHDFFEASELLAALQPEPRVEWVEVEG